MIRTGWLVPAAALTLAATIATVASAHSQQSTTREDDKDLARVGRETLEKVCSDCHGIEESTGRRRTAREWKSVVVSMANHGASASEEQLALVTKYLNRYFGLLAVNIAPAAEFSEVLGLSEKDANAIVEYRKTHGKFADADALAKVPGVDKSKIVAQLEALIFE